MSDVHCFYVSEGLLTPRHVQRIGGSLWEFLWLISHETRMEGKVLNGSPITISRIADELGESIITAKRNLSRLSREGYVVRKRSATGKTYSYSIAHSKKWKIYWDESGIKNDPTSLVSRIKNDTGVGSKMIPSGIKNDPTNKDIDRLDNIDKTVCAKCGGLGIILQLIPSELIPEQQKENWVKCNECQRS